VKETNRIMAQISTEHQRYYQLGKTYWWFNGKYRLVEKLLHAPILANAPLPLHILDAGCGPGHFMERLQAYGEVTGTDYSLKRLQYCREEGFQYIAQTDLRRIPFKDNTFDLVTTIDTIEHIQEDAQAIREIHRVIKPGGMIALTVPAFMLLWGSHDVNQGHFKRYRVQEMTWLLEQTGFEIVKATYAEFLWFFPLLVIRKLKALKDKVRPSQPSDDFMFLPTWLNTILTALIVCEAPILQQINLPLGVTMICIARKK
jgi:ubiquinone/menaquinone biosynthesis C-methylase UbiE